MNDQVNSVQEHDSDNLWTYASLVATATLTSLLVSIPLLSDAIFSPLSLLIAAMAILCGLRFGPVPLLLAAITFLAATEPAQMLANQPLQSILIVVGIATAVVCITRARSIAAHQQLRIRQLRGLLSQTSRPPANQLSNTFTSIATTTLTSVGIVLFVLWLIPLSANSLRAVGLRPTALRALQIMFLFSGVYVVIRLFIAQMALRRMRPAQARVYLVSLLSGTLLPDVRGMYKKPRRKRKTPKPSAQK